MANKAIGLLRCPVCRSDKARVSVSKAGYTVATCHHCHMQLFTRSVVSDGALRGLMRPIESEPEPEVAPEVKSSPAPEAVPDLKSTDLKSTKDAQERPGFLMW